MSLPQVRKRASLNNFYFRQLCWYFYRPDEELAEILLHAAGNNVRHSNAVMCMWAYCISALMAHNHSTSKRIAFTMALLGKKTELEETESAGLNSQFMGLQVEDNRKRNFWFRLIYFSPSQKTDRVGHMLQKMDLGISLLTAQIVLKFQPLLPNFGKALNWLMVKKINILRKLIRYRNKNFLVAHFKNVTGFLLSPDFYTQ